MKIHIFLSLSFKSGLFSIIYLIFASSLAFLLSYFILDVLDTSPVGSISFSVFIFYVNFH